MKRIAQMVLLLGLVATVLFTAYWLSGLYDARQPAEFFAYGRRAAESLPKLWRAPEFVANDQQGRTATAAALKGHPWIADFIYTQCSSACPMITSRMVLLQRALADVDVHFVSFSVDPDHDSPPVLRDYARLWNPSEARWLLLATPKERLHETVDGFRVTAERSTDPANPIIHSSVFLLVDSEGWVRGVYDSNDAERRTRLIADVKQLASSPAAPPSPAEGSPHGSEARSLAEGSPRGSEASLYAALGCEGCHANARIAPSLANLSGSDVKLTDGTHVAADEAYLRRSIIDPGDQIVDGYLNLMPSYADSISNVQLGALVREIQAMTTAETPDVPAGPATLVTDPVCGMSVRAAAETPHLTYRGRDVYFCSETCRDSFLKHPERFEKQEAAPGGLTSPSGRQPRVVP